MPQKRVLPKRVAMPQKTCYGGNFARARRFSSIRLSSSTGFSVL